MDSLPAKLTATSLRITLFINIPVFLVVGGCSDGYLHFFLSLNCILCRFFIYLFTSWVPILMNSLTKFLSVNGVAK